MGALAIERRVVAAVETSRAIGVMDSGRVARSLAAASDLVAARPLVKGQYATLLRVVDRGASLVEWNLAQLAEHAGGDANAKLAVEALRESHQQIRSLVADVNELRATVGGPSWLPLKGMRTRTDATQLTAKFSAAADATKAADIAMRNVKGVEPLTLENARSSVEELAKAASTEFVTASPTDRYVAMGDEVAKAQGKIRPAMEGVRKLFFGGVSHGTENIPLTGRVIIAPTHGSIVDSAFIVPDIKRSVRSMAAQEFVEAPVLGTVISKYGAFPLDRKDAALGLSRARGILHDEQAMVGYPSGHIEAIAAPGEPRLGIAELALETNTPVVPAATFGGKRVFGKSFLQRRGDVVRKYGAPIHFAQVPVTQSTKRAAMETIWREVDKLHTEAAAEHAARRESHGALWQAFHY